MILLPPPTRLLVSRLGLDPDKDVSYVQVGDVPVLMAALTAGNKTIDGATIQPPYYQKLVASGVRVLANMQEMDISFQQTGLNTTQKFVAKSPDVVRRRAIWRCTQKRNPSESRRAGSVSFRS